MPRAGSPSRRHGACGPFRPRRFLRRDGCSRRGSGRLRLCGWCASGAGLHPVSGFGWPVPAFRDEVREAVVDADLVLERLRVHEVVVEGAEEHTVEHVGAAVVAVPPLDVVRLGPRGRCGAAGVGAAAEPDDQGLALRGVKRRSVRPSTRGSPLSPVTSRRMPPAQVRRSTEGIESRAATPSMLPQPRPAWRSASVVVTMTSWPGLVGPAFASSEADMPAFSSARIVSKSNWALLRRSPSVSRQPDSRSSLSSQSSRCQFTPRRTLFNAARRTAASSAGREAPEGGHAVEPFAAQGEGPLAVLLVLVGLGAVGIEIGAPRVGVDPEQLGADLAGDLGERGLGDRQLLAIRSAPDGLQGLHDDPRGLEADLAGLHRGGDLGVAAGHLVAGQREPRLQRGAEADASLRLPEADPSEVGDEVRAVLPPARERETPLTAGRMRAHLDLRGSGDPTRVDEAAERLPRLRLRHELVIRAGAEPGHRGERSGQCRACRRRCFHTRSAPQGYDTAWRPTRGSVDTSPARRPRHPGPIGCPGVATRGDFRSREVATSGNPRMRTLRTDEGQGRATAIACRSPRTNPSGCSQAPKWPPAGCSSQTRTS